MNDVLDFLAVLFMKGEWGGILRRYITMATGSERHLLSDTSKFVCLHSAVKLVSNLLHCGMEVPDYVFPAVAELLEEYADQLSAHTSAPDVSANFVSEPWIDQVLLILEVVGLILTGGSHSF